MHFTFIFRYMYRLRAAGPFRGNSSNEINWLSQKCCQFDWMQHDAATVFLSDGIYAIWGFATLFT